MTKSTRSSRMERINQAGQDLANRYGAALIGADRNFEKRYEEGTHVVGLTVKLPREIGDDFLIVVRAQKEEARVVAFHGAPTFAEAVVGMLTRLQQDTLKWKEDEYAR